MRWLKVIFLDREWNRAIEGAAITAERFSLGENPTAAEQDVADRIASMIRRKKRTLLEVRVKVAGQSEFHRTWK